MGVLFREKTSDWRYERLSGEEQKKKKSSSQVKSIHVVNRMHERKDETRAERHSDTHFTANILIGFFLAFGPSGFKTGRVRVRARHDNRMLPYSRGRLLRWFRVSCDETVHSNVPGETWIMFYDTVTLQCLHNSWSSYDGTTERNRNSDMRGYLGGSD